MFARARAWAMMGAVSPDTPEEPFDESFDESTDARFDDPYEGNYDSDNPDFSDDDDGGVSRGYAEANVDRAPICRYCGVTALPAHRSNVIDTPFVCDNEDCEAFGEAVYL
jgi:hypothetical protein